MAKYVSQVKKEKEPLFFFHFLKQIHTLTQFLGGHSMVQTIDSTTELRKFLNNNLDFYTEEWIEYLKKNKSYITSLLKENGDMLDYPKKTAIRL